MTSITQKTRFQRKRCRPALAALVAAALLTCGSAAVADDCWTITECELLVPDACTYTVSGSESYCRVRIEGTGTIDIPAGTSLTVCRALSVSEDGTIQFSGDSGSPGEFVAAANLRMDGTFKVAGSAGGVIQSYAGGDVLTISSSGKIEAPDGPLTLSADLEMDGTVTADGPHTITVDTYGPRAGSSGTWEVKNASGKIKIAIATTLNSGQVLISAGIFGCRQDFTTGGGVKLTGGQIKVSYGKTFTASGPYSAP